MQRQEGSINQVTQPSALSASILKGFVVAEVSRFFFKELFFNWSAHVESFCLKVLQGLALKTLQNDLNVRNSISLEPNNPPRCSFIAFQIVM